MVDKNFKQEACQLYIEQEIEARLELGKTPGKIGKELTKEISTLFESKVKPATIKKRAQRIGTNVPKSNRDKIGTNSKNRDKIGTNPDPVKKPVDSIVLTDRELLKSIRSLAYDTSMPINTILALGLESYKATYL